MRIVRSSQICKFACGTVWSMNGLNKHVKAYVAALKHVQTMSDWILKPG